MCGILFTLNSKKARPIKADDFMRDAFLASQVRGTDGAGLFQVDFDGKIRWNKAGQCATKFLESEETKRNLVAANTHPITVGHVRAATSGGVSTQNTHPFQINREDGSYVIGVHNGTVAGWRYREDASECSLDSEWIYHMIAKYGFDAFKRIDGAFALVWYDTNEPGKVFMTRNKERPLHYMITEDRETIFGASEPGMLGWCTQRNGFYPKSGESCFYLEPDKIYAFDLTGNKLGRFDSWTRPDYDPMIAYPRGSSSSYQSQVDLYDDDETYGDGYPWYPGVTNYSNNYYNHLADQEKCLRNCKAALTSEPLTVGSIIEDDDDNAHTEVVIDQEQLQKAVANALANQMGEEVAPPVASSFRTEEVSNDPITDGQLFLLNVHGSSSTRGEIQAAKTAKLFGLVVNFKGMEYDEETRSCIGTAETVIEGTPTTLEGEIRFVPEKVAWDLYINRKHDVAILTGLRLSENWAVFEMPDQAQRAHIRDMVAKFASTTSTAVN